MRFSFKSGYMDYLKRSGSDIPQHMRDMIDEAVAAGRITKVAAGKSAEAYMVWNPEKQALIAPDAKTAVQLHREARARAIRASMPANASSEPKPVQSRKKTREEAGTRKERVREMYLAGHTYKHISEVLGCNPNRVKKDVYEMLKAEPKMKREARK